MKSLTAEMKDATLLSWIAGLYWDIPSLSKQTSNRNVDILAACRAILILFTHIFCFLSLIVQDVEKEQNNFNKVEIMALSIAIIILISAYGRGLFKSAKTKKLFDLLKEIDETLKHLIYEQAQTKSLLFNSNFYNVFHSCWMIINIGLIIFWHCHFNEVISYLKILQISISNYVIWVTVFDFGLFTTMLMGYLQHINSLLENISLATMCDVSPYTTRAVYPRHFTMTPCLSIFGIEDHQFKSEDVASHKLRNIADLFSKILTAKDLTNAVFEYTLLAIITRVFVAFIFNMFYLWLTVKRHTVLATDFCSFLHLSIYNYVIIHYIVEMCSRYEVQVCRTKIMVQKIIAQNINKSVTRKATMFSIQLLHNNPKFSACGFFHMDYSLLLAVIGSATTYLVILIQFGGK